MPKTLIKSRLHSNKNKPKIKQEISNTKSNLPPHLQSFKQKLLSGNGFVNYNMFQKHDYLKIYHQQRFNLNKSNQTNEFFN